MNNGMTQSIHSVDSKATEKFGERLGRNLRGGEIIELNSDLGGGKTTLTRGIVRGAGSGDVAASPTFTVSKLYKAPNFDIKHYDFYRLPESGIMEYELQDCLNDPKIVIIIEWGDIVRHTLPRKRLTINLEVAGDDARKIKCTYLKEMEYLLA